VPWTSTASERNQQKAARRGSRSPDVPALLDLRTRTQMIRREALLGATATVPWRDSLGRMCGMLLSHRARERLRTR
jgi:hypothetical protein